MAYKNPFPIVVANIAALSAVDDSKIADVTVAFVRTLQDAFVLDKSSTLGTDGITIVATLSGSGRWLRYELPSRAWRSQSTWHINPSTGSDENRGDSAGSALATHAELMRRLGRVADTIHIINIDADLNEDLVIDQAHDRTDFPSGGLIYNGGTSVVRSGTITGVTAYDPATRQDGRIEDSGIVDWAADVDKRIVLTSGANAGAWAWIATDLTSGGTATARHSPFITSTFGSIVTPAVNDEYDIVDLRTVTGKFGIGPLPALVQFNDFRFQPPSGKAVVYARFAIFSGCDLEGDDFTFENGAVHTVSGSRLRALSGAVDIGASTVDFLATLVESQLRVNWAGRLRILRASIGQSPIANGGTDVWVAPRVEPEAVFEIDADHHYGVFDMGNATFAALTVRPGGLAELGGNLWGTGNSMDDGIIVSSAGRIVYDVAPDVQTPAVNEVVIGATTSTYAGLPATDAANLCGVVQRTP